MHPRPPSNAPLFSQQHPFSPFPFLFPFPFFFFFFAKTPNVRTRRHMAHGEDRHVELPTAEVSSGWSNDPALLRVKPYFMDRHRVNECLHPTLYFLHPQLILKDAQSTYIFEEKGRGYFVWNDISGSVAETKEKSLEDIIVKLSDSGLASITLSPLRTLDDPSEEPTSNIPYPLNPDFVDRSCLTKIFRIPPHRSILLYGPAGCG